jgi:hypothetical protein
MSKESNVEKTVDDRVIELINDRPYYICKVNDKHTDLQSQLGSIDGTYGREHDRVNEQYLLEGIKALIASEVKKAVDEERDWWIATAPDKYSVERIKQIQDMSKSSHIGTLTQEKNKWN